MKKLLPKRKPERKPSDEEFALRKSEYAPRVAEDMGPSRALTAWRAGDGGAGGFPEASAVGV